MENWQKQVLNCCCWMLMSIMITCDVSVSCPLSCDCVGTTVNCSSRLLSEVPEGVPSNVTNLILSHNLLTTLGAQDFSSLTQLQELDLSFNSLNSISDSTFNDNTQLLKLYLNNNNISCLEETVFASLGEVAEITVANNALTELPADIFTSCNKLFLVFLAHNGFNHSVFEAFRKTWWIRHIDLSGNEITLLPYKALYASEELQYLELQMNAIEHIDVNSLLGLRSLQFLDLSGNKIKTLKREVFHPLEVISQLDLSHNVLLCDCYTWQFQDWFIHDNSGVSFASTVLCYDERNSMHVDVQYGNLSQLCDGSGSPIQACQPSCAANARISIQVDAKEKSATLKLITEGVSMLGQAQSDCREIGTDNKQSFSSAINESTVAIDDLTPGTMYACCSLVVSCDIYTCSEFTTLGNKPFDPCSNLLALKISLGIAVILLIVITTVIFIIMCIRNYRRDKSDKKPDVTSPIDTRQHKAISHTSLTSHITMDTSLSFNSLNASQHNMQGRPLPPISYRPESTYEHIPFEYNINTGFENSCFHGSTIAVADTNENTDRDPKTGMSSTYLTPVDSAKPTTPPSPKKPRRFVKQKNNILKKNSSRLRCDTMPSVGTPKIAYNPDRVKSVSVPEISYDPGFREQQQKYAGSANADMNNIGNNDTVCPQLPPKKNKLSLAELGGIQCGSHCDSSTSGDEKCCSSQEEDINSNSDCYLYIRESTET